MYQSATRDLSDHRPDDFMKNIKSPKTPNFAAFEIQCAKILALTRMHSSGMRNARMLTVSQHALRSGGVCPGVCLEGGLPGGGSARGVCIPASNRADTALLTDRHL